MTTQSYSLEEQEALASAAQRFDCLEK